MRNTSAASKKQFIGVRQEKLVGNHAALQDKPVDPDCAVVEHPVHSLMEHVNMLRARLVATEAQLNSLRTQSAAIDDVLNGNTSIAAPINYAQPQSDDNIAAIISELFDRAEVLMTLATAATNELIDIKESISGRDIAA